MATRVIVRPPSAALLECQEETRADDGWGIGPLPGIARRRDGGIRLARWVKFTRRTLGYHRRLSLCRVPELTFADCQAELAATIGR